MLEYFWNLYVFFPSCSALLHFWQYFLNILGFHCKEKQLIFCGNDEYMVQALCNTVHKNLQYWHDLYSK